MTTKRGGVWRGVATYTQRITMNQIDARIDGSLAFDCGYSTCDRISGPNELRRALNGIVLWRACWAFAIPIPGHIYCNASEE